MTEAEIDVALSAGFLEIDKEDLDGEGLYRLVVRNGWLVYHESFNENAGLWRIGGTQDDYVPLSGTLFERAPAAYVSGANFLS